MAHRKNIENWLEKDCKFWGIDLTLVNATCTDYVWHLTHQNTTYEITYNDYGQLAVNALPSKIWPKNEIREIYVGDSYQTMIGVLSDNFSNTYY